MLLTVSLFAFLFETPLGAAAVAGGAVSIPVIIHLLNRRRFRVVTWAAMRFLLAAQRKNSRRMRLEQLLLLAVRCLVVLLLVLAMASVTAWAESLWRWANPAGGKGLVTGGLRTHKILVVDASVSMSLKVGDTTCFERARALAEQIVQEGDGKDAFSVVLMAAPPRRVVSEPSEDARKVLAEIKAQKQTHGNADLPGTLATVAGLLKASPGKFAARDVYFLTDMQHSTWIAHRPAELAASLQIFQERKARAIFLDVGQDGVGNLAVTNLELAEPVATTGRETPIVATLHNFGDTRDDVSVRLFVGRAKSRPGDKSALEDLRQVGEQIVPRAKRGQQAVAFAYKFKTPGDYLVQVQVAGDSLEADDRRSAVVTVKDTVPVLLVNGKHAVEAFDRATEWVRRALNPFDDGEAIPPFVTARPKVLRRVSFADEGLGDLAPYDCVFLCDVASFSPGEVRRLEAFVRRGGGVVFCLGEGVAESGIAAYNEALYRKGEGLLPARLLGRQQATPGYTYHFALDAQADRLDPLKPFRDAAARARLLAPSFRQFILAEPAPRGGPRKVLGFAASEIPGRKATASKSTPPPGGPAILEWHPPLRKDEGGRMKDEKGKEGLTHPSRGRVVLIASTVNSDWNTWPASQGFLPLMQELMYFAAAPRLREQAVSVGQPLEFFLSGAAAGSEATVFAPDGRQEVVRAQAQGAEAGVLRWLDTDLSGVYRMVVGQQPREYLFAANVPAVNESQQLSESDLARTNKEDLQKIYPEWDLQVVADLRQVQRASAVEKPPVEVYVPQGTGIAHVLLLTVLALLLAEVVLAWQFGHYSAVAATAGEEQPAPKKRGARGWALIVLPCVLFAFFLGLASVLLHNAWTGDFLGFVPEGMRGLVERALDIPPPAPGEGSHWRLEYASYFWDGQADPWLAGCLAVGAAALFFFVYRREGRDVTPRFRLLLGGLRLGLLLLTLAVFLPQLRLHFERQGWPDVVILIDDSLSMSTFDVYGEPRTKAAADALVEKADLSEQERDQLARALVSRPELTRASRLRLAQTLLTRGGEGDDWLTNLLTRRKVRLHVYRCSVRAHRIADVTQREEIRPALDAIANLRAEPGNDSSQLGAAVRQVLNDFRGASLAAVVMLTDGVTTEGEDLGKVSKYASQMGVPLYFVGVGDAQETRDVYLHDLEVAENVYVHDRLVFQLQLTAQGYPSRNLPVSLYEKGKDKPLDTKTFPVDPANKTVKVQLEHRPTEPGEKIYVIKVPVQAGEVDKDNNRVERQVFVREAKLIKVLYVEGYRRYEYHYLKTLLERESNRLQGNKSIDLKVLLLDADGDFAAEDRSAISTFPTKEELKSYDVVILGDVDPLPADDPKMTEHLKDLADFVREHGGGLLMIAGERYAPRAYKNSPLKDVLPIDLEARARGEEADDAAIVDTYRPELLPLGRQHPLFRFTPDEKGSEDIWKQLKEMFWYADGYVPKRAAEVLAVHPKVRGLRGEGKGAEGGGLHPLVVQQFVGAGRSLFVGFDETWRWNWREDQAHYNHFWLQAMRYLARSRLGRIELRLDRQTPYRRGEPIKITVRFPDDAPAPPENSDVRVVVERRAPGRAADREQRTVRLAHVKGSRATFEALLTQTPEGDYKVWLTQPAAPNPKPHAECKVLAPPGEMEQLRMNQPEMERAASESHGKFYTLADAGRLADELPAGSRVTVNAQGPPAVLWNSAALFLLALGFLTAEWLFRKQKNLL